MERLVERALQAVAAWLAADASGCRLAAACANLQWRGALLAAADGCAAPARSPGRAPSRLPGALRAFPGLCPRLQRVHLREAARSAAGLHTAVLPLLHDALGGLARAAAEAWELACAGGGGGGAGEDAAALLAQLRQALAARTCARVRWAAALQAGEGDGGGGGSEEGGAAALAAQAEAWGEVARQWEGGALLLGEEFAALEAGVWRATAGAASLRQLCGGGQEEG